MRQRCRAIKKWKPVTFWALTAVVYAAPISTAIFIRGESQTLLQVLLQGGAIAVAGIGAWWLARVGLSRFVLASALAVLVLAALAQVVLLRVVAFPEAASATFNEIIRFEVNRYQELQGRVSRTWTGISTQSPIMLSFQALLLEGYGEGGWQPSDSKVSVVRFKDEAGTVVSRLTFPDSVRDPYARQTFVSSAPLAGRTFQFKLRMRAENPSPERGCRGVWLQVWGEGGASQCFPVRLGAVWRQVSATWRVPEGVIGNDLEIVLNDFDGSTIEVASPVLEELVDESWVDVGPLVFAGASGRFTWRDGGGQGEVDEWGLRLESSWQEYHFVLQPVEVERGTAEFVLSVPNGDFMAVKDLRISGLNQTRIEGKGRRLTLFTDHANQGGHEAVSIGGALLGLVSSTWSVLTTGVVTTVLVLGTQSRTALIVLGMVFLTVALFSASKRMALTISLVVALMALLLSFAGPLGISRLVTIASEGHGRLEVWQVAVRELIRHPLTGSSVPISTFFSTAHPVNHAHNYVLDLAYNYGAFGLLSGVSLLTLISWRAFASGGLKMGVIILVLLTLQITDTTFADLKVFAPLIVAIEKSAYQRVECIEESARGTSR